MISELEKNLSPFIQKGQTLIVGFSGGPDSVFLLFALEKLQKHLGIHLIAAHLNHKLRGKESMKDAVFAQKFCKKLNIPFEIQTLDIKRIAKKHKKNLEECGREYRYAFFRELKKKHKATWIVTAHHLDDNIETVLLNFARGCGINGISGMNIRNRDILRPLLTIPKNRILDFLEKNTLEYREDSTNMNKKFIRNFARLEIVPLLRKLNPAFDDVFIRNWTYFQELKNFMETLADTVIARSKYNERRSNLIARASHQKSLSITITTSAFHILPAFLQGEILKKIHTMIHGSTQSLSKTAMDQVIELLKNAKTGKMKTFGGVTALIHSDHIEFFKKNLKKIPRHARLAIL
ncbi:tRNA lysidine(34) synthetase TilS [Candidatus Peregrinibacteria bacterium]|nr:tRNA lysidine(34) synthetase TilS [Candidatus Peregrinibacteria bacterium]